ncbi:MAG TPA: spermidine/putrescine ABC transporter substrate-binding protein [Actinomycetota bacterium]|nr:spermidine/putrescine ABC transporter substrate-binding protein [Actinomycetota bacterium]
MTGHPRERWNRDGISRRAFLQRSAVAAAATPSLAAILAACTKPGTATPVSSANGPGTGKYWPKGSPYPIARQNAPVTWHLWQDPIPPGQSPETGATLQIYNWADYVNLDVVKAFAKHYDCKYQITTFNNMDEAMAKMRTAHLKFDIFFPTIDTIGKLVTAKLIQPLQHAYVPHLVSDVWGSYQNPFYDQGWHYTVPYTIYTTGLAYRRDIIPDATIAGMSNPWEIMWDPTYKGKVGTYDEYRDTICLALLKNGFTDLNTANQAELDKAQASLIDMIDAVDIRVDINGTYIGIPKGNFYLHLAWSGDAVAAGGYWPKPTMANFEKMGYWFPADKKGGVDNDTIAIPTNAQHPVLAHAFLDWLVTYENAMTNFAWTGYQPPQRQADIDTLTTTKTVYGLPYVFPWMPDAVVREEDFQQALVAGELTPQVDQQWRNVWQAFQAGRS